MARSTYGRDAFEGLRLFIMVSCFVTSVFFTVLHSSHRLFYNPSILSANSRLLKNAILGANWMFLTIYTSFFLTYTVISPEDNIPTCRGLQIWGAVSYTGINFCIYRVLLYRSQAYDVMKEYQKIYFYVYWGVHIVCPILVVGVAFVASIGNYEIRTDNIRGGNRLCVIDGFQLMPFLSGSVPALLAAFADFGISLGCLTLLVLPLLKPGFTPKGNTGALRNVIFSSIAILSTFTALLVMAIFEFKDGYWTVGLVIEIGAVDLIINIICVNLCWPVKFYLKTMKCLYYSATGVDPASVDSVHLKKVFSSGAKSKGHVKSPQICSKGSEFKLGGAHDANINGPSPLMSYKAPIPLAQHICRPPPKSTLKTVGSVQTRLTATDNMEQSVSPHSVFSSTR